jgi:hypothetical protein
MVAIKPIKPTVKMRFIDCPFAATMAAWQPNSDSLRLQQAID